MCEGVSIDLDGLRAMLLSYGAPGELWMHMPDSSPRRRAEATPLSLSNGEREAVIPDQLDLQRKQV